MSNLIPVVIPRESVSDDRVILCALNFKNGALVSEGQIIATVETSKATFDIEATATGSILFKHAIGAEIPIGGLLAEIAAEGSSAPNATHTPAATNATSEDVAKIVFSKKALALIDQHKLDKAFFVGKELVSENDVLNVISSQNQTPLINDLKFTPKSIVIVGGGGHAKMVIDLLKQCPDFLIAGIVDRDLPLGSNILGIPVIGRDADLPALLAKGCTQAVNALGHKRVGLNQKLKEAGFVQPNIIHPKAIVEPSAILGYGNQIMHGAIVGSQVKIGNNCIINSGSIISHDSVIADNVHLAPGSILGGRVKIGSDTLVGMGVTIFVRVSIGAKVMIYNGCRITKNVPDNQIVENNF